MPAGSSLPRTGLTTTSRLPDPTHVLLPSQRPHGRPAAPRAHRTRLHPSRRRLGAGQLRRYPRAVHRQCGEPRAELPARQGRRLGHCRIRHAAAFHPHPLRPRSRARQAGRTHAGNPAPDRPRTARLRRPQCTGRTHHHPGLRRAAGRRRHPYRRHHRCLRGAGRRGEPAAQAWRHQEASADRRSGCGVGGYLPRRAGAGSGLPGRQRLRYRHERGDERRWRLHRVAGHGRRPCLPPRRTQRPARTRRKGVGELFELQRAALAG